MPVVKNYGTPKAEIAPLPASRRTAAPTAETFGADAGDKLSKVGSALYEDELLRQDQVATLEADRKLSDVENKLLYDPKDGALTKRGKDAFGLPDTVGAAYDKSTDEVRQGLTNDRQRVAFDRAVAARRKDINSTLSRHVFKEMQAFDDTETENYLKNSVDAAVNNYNDPTRIQTEVDRQRAAVVDYASRHGLGPEYVKQKIGASVSSTHYNVIGRFIARGEDQSASEYFKKFGDEITDDKLKTDAEHKLQSAVTEGQGMRTADDVWKQLGPKSDIDPVNVDKMLDQVRTLHADDPKLAKAASDQIKERANAFNAGQRERSFANQSEVWKAVEQGGKLNDIRRMPEFLALPGAMQNQVKDHVIDRGYTMQQRARADAEYQEGQKAKAGYGKYWELSSARTLSGMSENEIQTLYPTLGRVLTNKLMEDKRSLSKSEDAVRQATLDDDQFNQLANDAGLKPFDNKKSSDEKEALGRLRDTIKTQIDAEQRATGKVLTRERKGQIAQELIDKKVLQSTWYSIGSLGANEVPAAMVKKNDLGNAFVPIDRVPSASQKQIVNLARSYGAIPAGVSDADALRQYRDRIERAYAMALSRAPDESIRNVLTGKR